MNNNVSLRREKIVYGLLLLSFYILAYLLPLGSHSLFIPDETRYAEVPREMIASGNWAVPHLDGVRYFEKPVLGYWVHAVSQMIFGANSFAVRLPEALATGLAALFIFLIVRKSQRENEESDWFLPFAATLVFLSTAEVFGIGNLAVLDNLLALWLTACITTFFFATEAGPGSLQEKGWLLAAGFFCGLAFLTKGFLAFAVPVLTLVPYLLWQRRPWDLLRMSWLPLLTAILVSLPWAWRIHQLEPDFWHYFFWVEHIKRFTADNAQHKESFWFFFVLSPVLALPWTFLTPAAFSGVKTLWKENRYTPLLRLALCWLIVPFLFFSASHGKLLTYILPCFAPFAILMGLGLQRVLRNARSSLFQWGVLVNAFLFTLVLIGFVLVQFAGVLQLPPFGQAWKGIMVINSLFFFLLFCFWAFQGKTPQVKITFAGMALLFLYFVAHYTIPDKTLESKCPGPLLERIRPTITAQDIIIADEDTMHAVCWTLQRNDIYLAGTAGEFAYGMNQPAEIHRRLQTPSTNKLGLIEQSLEPLQDFIHQHQGKIVFVTRANNYQHWRSKLPQPLEQEQNGEKGTFVLRF